MRIAYLIVAHDNPRHLRRLVDALASESSSFFVHIDRKSRLREFVEIAGPNVHVSKTRVPVFWGDFSQVEATLILLRRALADPRHFDYFVLLSGTDYPLRSVSCIESYFERNAGKEFMNIVPMPCEVVGKPLSRLTTYKQRPGARSSSVAVWLRERLAGARARCVERDHRAYLRNLVPFAGSSWWALSRGACEYIVRFVSAEPRVVRFFENTDCPDESFFHTVLGNSPFCARIRPNLTYTDWRDDASSPEDLTETHVEYLESSPCLTIDQGAYGVGEVLFARKLSDRADRLVARIDRLRMARG